MGINIFSLSKLYPGQIWVKRFGYLLLVYSIGINCFVGTIQNKVIEMIDEKTNQIETSNMLLSQNKFPNLEMIKIEKDSNIESLFKWFRKLASNIDYEIITVDRINEIADISNKVNTESQKISIYISKIKSLLDVFLKVIQITSNIIWLSIIWAIIWLYFDIQKGKAKVFVKRSLVLSIPFNIFIFYSLTSFLSDFLYTLLLV